MQTTDRHGMQGHGRCGVNTGAGGFGSFVSGAAPASISTSTKPLQRISEAHPMQQATVPESYYAADSPSAAGPSQPPPTFSSKRISTGAFQMFPGTYTPMHTTRRHAPVPPVCAPRPASAAAPGATRADAVPRAVRLGDALPQGSPPRPSIAAAVTAAMVASAMSAGPPGPELDRERSTHSTPAGEGPQHVYDSDGAPGSGSAGGASSSVDATPMSTAKSVEPPVRGSVTSGTTQSGTAGATYDPLSDARKQQRMVELASLLSQSYRANAAAASPVDTSASAKLAQRAAGSPLPLPIIAANARPLNPEAAPMVSPDGMLAGDVEVSLYQNIVIPKPTSSSYEDRSMERSVDSAFRVRGCSHACAGRFCSSPCIRRSTWHRVRSIMIHTAIPPFQLEAVIACRACLHQTQCYCAKPFPSIDAGGLLPCSIWPSA